MIKLELTEEQCNYLYVLLDTELKTNGLHSLGKVVDIHNVLTKAVKQDNKKESDKFKKVVDQNSE